MWRKKYAQKTNIARIFITFYLLHYTLNDSILIVVYTCSLVFWVDACNNCLPTPTKA